MLAAWQYQHRIGKPLVWKKNRQREWETQQVFSENGHYLAENETGNWGQIKTSGKNLLDISCILSIRKVCTLSLKKKVFAAWIRTTHKCKTSWLKKQTGHASFKAGMVITPKMLPPKKKQHGFWKPAKTVTKRTIYIMLTKKCQTTGWKKTWISSKVTFSFILPLKMKGKTGIEKNKRKSYLPWKNKYAPGSDAQVPESYPENLRKKNNKRNHIFFCQRSVRSRDWKHISVAKQKMMKLTWHFYLVWTKEISEDNRFGKQQDDFCKNSRLTKNCCCRHLNKNWWKDLT